MDSRLGWSPADADEESARAPGIQGEGDARPIVQIIGSSGIYHLLEPGTKSRCFRVPRPAVRPPLNRGFWAAGTPCHRQVSTAFDRKLRLRLDSLNRRSEPDSDPVPA